VIAVDGEDGQIHLLFEKVFAQSVCF
jgi:hypothetical protein